MSHKMEGSSIRNPQSAIRNPKGRPRVIIVGGGFAGLKATQILKNSPVDILLLDRTNYHLFQPLLYQVATSVLAPNDIAVPLRVLLRHQGNAVVNMAEVTRVDPVKRLVHHTGAASPASYDFLILATGVKTSTFGHEEWRTYARGLKTVEDAVAFRNRLLKAFELAEQEQDPQRQQSLLTFVLVGAGPTGVEMAGALAELTHRTLPKEFRSVDPKASRIVLVDAGSRILPSFPECCSRKAADKLKAMGVTILTGSPVEKVDEKGVVVAGQRIESRCVFWAAGVEAPDVGSWLQTATDRLGRIQVLPDLTVPGHPEIFVVGDVACIESKGHPLAGVAQVALQTGEYAALAIQQRLKGHSLPPFPPFQYRDWGTMATVSDTFAIVDLGRFRASGFVAKLIWAFLHILYLSLFENRLAVLFRWTVKALWNRHGIRVIYGGLGREGGDMV